MRHINEWKSILGDDFAVPSEVSLCAKRLDDSGMPWRASWNYEKTEVFSCRHAVRFRQRLGSGGNGGIPLWAELYSLAGFVVDSQRGVKIPFAAHARANTEFRDDKIIEAVGLSKGVARIQRLVDETDVTSVQNQPCYGRINPFSVDLVFQRTFKEQIELSGVIQLFDESLSLDGGIPNTVMTNLWDRRLAFEIEPQALMRAVTRLSPRSHTAMLTEPSKIWLGLEGKPVKDYWRAFPPPRGPKIGILTGNAPESGLQLWEDILGVLRAQYEHLPDVLMPEMYIHSLPEMGLSMDLVEREDDVWLAMHGAIGKLLDVGCKVITLACNTTIYFEPRIVALCEKHDARFVSIAEACMPAIRGALKSGGGGSVGLVGIGPVVDMTGPYSGYKRHLDADTISVTPCPGDDLAFKAKSEGASDILVTEFRRLINNNLSNVRVIVLALTEVSMLYRRHIAKAKKGYSGERVFIDPLLELAKYLSWIYVTKGFRECVVCQIPSDLPIEDMLMHTP
jgi:aspartate/glutamate racemase